MSSDVVACPQCGTNLQNSEGIAGQVVACPQCQTQLQMPPLSQPASVPQLPGMLPPAIEDLPPPLPEATGGASAPGPAPLVQTKRSGGKATASVSDRLRKRTNPVAIVLIAVMVVILLAVGIAAYVAQQTEAARQRFAKEMIGNWELVPGQSNLDRWDFAFHNDGRLQMALRTELSEGRWKVTSVRKSTGYVLIEWPDSTVETMRVRLESGTLQISLDSVGDFAFRAAAP